MGLYKDIMELKKDIEEREAKLRADKAKLEKKENEFQNGSMAFGKQLAEEASRYQRQVLDGKDTPEYPDDLKIVLSKVIFRYPVNQDSAYCYVAAAPVIAGYCDRASKESKIARSDPRLKLIEPAIVGDGIMIEVGDKAIYRKKFLPVVIYFVKHRKLSPEEAVKATKDALEGRIEYRIDDIDKYLYELELKDQESVEMITYAEGYIIGHA